MLAALDRDRWQLETAFCELTVYLCCELNTLGSPPAALFGFCAAVACYNVLAAVKGALRAAHGKEAEENLSSYYVTAEVSGTYRGMAIAVPDEDWAVFRTAGPVELAGLLTQLRPGHGPELLPQAHPCPQKAEEVPHVRATQTLCHGSASQ